MMKRVGVGIALAVAVLLTAFLWPRHRAAGGRAGDAIANRGSGRGRLADPFKRPKSGISGHVCDGAGTPTPSAQVCARAWSEELSSNETRVPFCTLSNGNGEYEITNLLPARYSVSAAAPHFKPAHYRDGGRDWFEISDGELKSGVDFVLDAGGVQVHGRVKDISGGVVAGAIVSASAGQWWSRNESSVAKTDDKGEFELWVAPGSVNVTAHAQGYATGSKTGTAPGQFLEILVTPESVLTGRVVEAGTDKPVAGARVSAVNEGEWSPWGGQSEGTTFSDAQGRYRIERLQPSRYKPVAEAEGRFGKARESVRLGLGETSKDVVIEVHPALTVSGRVVLDDGKQPCPEGGISLRDEKRNSNHWATADRDGFVQVKALLPGTWTVHAWCRDFMPEDHYDAIVLADRPQSGLIWRVHKGLHVAGVVVDTGGATVPEARIALMTKGGAARGQRTNGWKQSERDGTFRVDGLLAGEYELRADADNLPEPNEPVPVKLEAGKSVDGLRVVLDRGGAIDGTVVDDANEPVSGATIRLEGAKWMWRENTFSRDDGTFEVKGVPPGEWRVVASREMWGSELRAPGTNDDDVQGRRTVVHAGQTSHVRLVVEGQSGRISGRVVGEDGKPVTDAFVDGQRESDSVSAAAGGAMREMRWGWQRQPALTDVDGKFTLEKLSPGSYTVRAYRKGGGEATAEHVKAGTTVTLTIPTPGSLSGVAVAANGAMPDTFTVAVTDRKSGFNRSESFYKTSGSWAIRDLPAGQFHVTADAPEGTAALDVPLAQGQAQDNVRLLLAPKSTVRGQIVSLDGGKPVPAMHVQIQPVKGGASNFFVFNQGDEQRKNVTDETGRFEVENAPTGRVYVTAFPLDWMSSEYGFVRALANVVPGQPNDVGQIKMAKRRIGPQDRGGDFGFQLKEQPPDIEPDQTQLVVSLIRPDGAAASSGLKVGDVIVSIDGIDVTGPNYYLYWSLGEVKEGTKVSFGLARGEKIAITAGKPL
jgi:protocatechuate 3,4-dioxygenase beta subunit